MELKLYLLLIPDLTKRSLNCTFMELKLEDPSNKGFGFIVLIVPLWN